ncbi:MAG TPA: LptF/LptG family permease [Myxococcaceae bacterium]|nr:LptF/LptG family permease [Myxococcaceae bacterium]
MSGTIFRYVLRTYLGYFAIVLFVLMAVFLVIDFVDSAKAYTGPAWVKDVLVLYGCKAVVAVQQLGPAALLLAGGGAVSALHKRGELTALEALGFGWLAHFAPIGLAALVLSGGLIAFDEYAVVKAGPRVDQITAQRFHRWGDWRFYFQPKQWFRIGDRIFYLRAGGPDEGFRDVTVLRFTPSFGLVQRIDAVSMVHQWGTRWRLDGVVERRFSEEGTSTLTQLGSAVYDLGAEKGALRIRKGRPEQMRLAELREQVEARAEVGLPSNQFSLALHNRFAYPLASVPAALLAVGLALRPGRRASLTVAIAEGLLIAAALWGLMVVSRTLVLSDRISPQVAAWLPVAVLVIAASVVWFHRETSRWRIPRWRVTAPARG